MKVKTSSGFSFNLDKKTLDDMRFVRKITGLQKLVNEGGALDFDDAMYIITKIVGGETELDRLIEHLEKKSSDGICHSETLTKEMYEMISLINSDETGKKSSTSPTS